MNGVSLGRENGDSQGRHDQESIVAGSRRDKSDNDSQWEGSEQEFEDEDEYADMEDDLEKISVISLFDDSLFDSVPAMLKHCVTFYGFDLAKIQKDLKLEFMDLIKLVNYVRQETKNSHGSSSLALTDKSAFDDDRYLQPVLKDDALLYSLDDILEQDLDQQEEAAAVGSATEGFDEGSVAFCKISELHQTLLQTQRELLATQQRLELAERALNTPKDLSEDMDGSMSKMPGYPESNKKTKKDYTGNYDGPELHRTMISDTKRTEAYRDFILGHRHLFKDQVVLDVGCGTGILSLFCAEAGAKLVIGVDQSKDIASRARSIVKENHKEDIIKIHHGRIQDIQISMGTVDIIISEWMGYCLLYEAMLDSVIFARDKYLRHGGLMIPSHSTLFIAPMSNPNYRAERLDFWVNVYGYDMSVLKSDVIRAADVDTVVEVSWLCAAASPFLHLNFYKAKVKDLSFQNSTFHTVLDRPVPFLDGFVLWFNVDFSPTVPDPVGSKPINMYTNTTEDANLDTSITLSTGPESEPTHWRQGVLLINRENMPSSNLVEGQHLEGAVSYEKMGAEGLGINVQWRTFPEVEIADGSVCPREGLGSEAGRQEWTLL